MLVTHILVWRQRQIESTAVILTSKRIPRGLAGKDALGRGVAHTARHASRAMCSSSVACFEFKLSAAAESICRLNRRVRFAQCQDGDFKAVLNSWPRRVDSKPRMKFHSAITAFDPRACCPAPFGFGGILAQETFAVLSSARPQMDWMRPSCRSAGRSRSSNELRSCCSL